MTTNNHPAHGPVSLNRLHQIYEILSKAAAQSDGGNLGYAMADAVKVIDGAIAAFGAEPVAYMHRSGQVVTREECCDDKTFAICCKVETPLYSAPSVPVVPPKIEPDYEVIKAILPTANPDFYACCVAADMWNACRAAMLQSEPVIQPYKLPPNSFTDEDLEMMAHGDNPQSNAYRELLAFRRNSQWIGNDSTNGKPLTSGYIAANSPVTPDTWIPVSERMPENDDMVNIVIKHVDGSHYVFTGQWWGSYWNTDSDCIDNENVTHWMPLPAAPQ